MCRLCFYLFIYFIAGKLWIYDFFFGNQFASSEDGASLTLGKKLVQSYKSVSAILWIGVACESISLICAGVQVKDIKLHTSQKWTASQIQDTKVKGVSNSKLNLEIAQQSCVAHPPIFDSCSVANLNTLLPKEKYFREKKSWNFDKMW